MMEYGRNHKQYDLTPRSLRRASSEKDDDRGEPEEIFDDPIYTRSFDECVRAVLESGEPEIDAYAGYPELQREIALPMAQDMHHEGLLHDLRRQREAGTESGKVAVLRTVVSLGDATSSHALNMVERRTSLGN